MPFPKEGTAWPPDDYRPWYNKITEWATWYSGDPQALLNLYSSQQFFPDNDWGRFWARIEAEERANAVHLPVAGDLASTSANLLFSEAPIINYDPKAAGGDRIEMFIKENGLLNTLLEAAETAAAMSGVFLKLDVDPELVKIPLLSIISPLQAIPYFKRGRLWEVLFFRTVKESESQSTIWRLFELRRRVEGKLSIEYKLFKGTSDRVGREVEMNSIDEVSSLGLEPITYAMDGLACVYIPNMKPNRLMPGSPLGINDYSGAITLMDSLDFAWSSWMRDIEMGMAQVIVDEEILEKPQGGFVNQDSNKARFNKFQRAFIKLNMSPWRMGGENVKPIEPIQFEIRVDEHMKTCENLFLQIVSLCGYSPQTFGLVEYNRQSDSGTALRIRERKSLLTREKKSRYWQTGLWDLFQQMQQLDIASNLSSSYQIQEVDIELQDSVVNDEREQSETLRNLDQAKAISIYQKVKRLHPDWEDKDIEEEVKRILDEQGATRMPFEDDLDRLEKARAGLTGDEENPEVEE
jgi:A118 family predicted phage portal protein